MLSISSYPRAYVDDCRSKIDAQMAAYAALSPAPGPAFDRPFFRHLLLALDHYFDHRARGQEGKDGGPLSELRMLCNSVMHDGGRLAADKQIRLAPGRSVSGLDVGDEIDLTADRFAALAQAVFADVERKYP